MQQDRNDLGIKVETLYMVVRMMTMKTIFMMKEDTCSSERQFSPGK